MQSHIQLTVNGETHHVAADSDRTLLDFLRNTLGLTGAKNGCDGKGICGACTVLIIPGQAVKSCRVKLASLDRQEILTVEGVCAGALHPLQTSFVNTGAIQCGFCTPGMIMSAKALLDRNPKPTKEEIARALQGNLCRCTGYTKIVQAVEEAAVALTTERPVTVAADGKAKPEIGDPLPPKMAIEKATGSYAFLDDLPVGDAAFGKIVWSAHEHARIIAVNVDESLKVPGVIAVMTASDIPGQNAFGLICDDQPVICFDRVRYCGDIVALVIAENAEAARHGASLVNVDYAPLPAVFDPEQALADGASHLFPRGNQGNLACEFGLENGDADGALDRADLVVAGEFSTPAVEHAYLEPEAGIAEWNNGNVTVRAACQCPRAVRRQIAKVLGQSEATVRIISHPTGGAFGGKTDILIHALLAVAAKQIKRPVRIVLSREESLRASVKNHPMRMRYRIGFDRHGRITGMKGDILANAGAYYALSIPLLQQTAAFSTGPYRISDVSIRVRGAFTNTPPSSAFRGFGIPQPTFAVESLIDEAAERLGLSPIEIRRRNALRPGDRSPTGQTMGADTHLIETLDVLEKEYLSLLKKGNPPGVGLGVACGYKNIGLGLGEDDYAEACIEILPARTVHLRVGAIDLGQGSSTVLAQIVACELGVPYRIISVEAGDTGRTPDARETNASRQSVVSGNAVLNAVENLKQRFFDEALRQNPWLQRPLHYYDGLIVDAIGTRVEIFELAEELAAAGKRLDADGMYTAPKTTPLNVLGEKTVKDGSYKNYFAYSFFSNLAVVYVDPESGRVRTKQIVSAYDVGKVLNRLTLEGQMEGGAIMGMGFALSEEYIPRGPKQTTNLAQCGVPRCMDAPVVISRFIEAGNSVGPYGAKGVGEVAMIAVAPAITNAIHNAIGIRIRNLPAKPAEIRRALLQQRSDKEEEK